MIKDVNGPSWHQKHNNYSMLPLDFFDFYGASTLKQENIIFLTPGFHLEYDLHAQIKC
jgi:hypothetical protein